MLKELSSPKSLLEGVKTSSTASGLPPSPPLDSFLSLDTQVEETCKPTPFIDSFGPVEVTLVDKLVDNPLPNFKVSPGHQNNIDGGNSEDKEFDELLCSFQKLSDGDGIGEQLKRNKKIKAKHKKKKLVVGGFSPPLGLLSQKNGDFPVDEEAAIKCIGEQLGYDFRSVSSNLDGQRSF
ncbi:hypothetical protein Tco_0726778 [Tanacetum coccineum]|uniref:Uncharacterized protein n=1 Tax=Tanacetum coccineum TaxID=301880 RepID=A0ABQ4YIW0_9ASTR